MNAIKNIGKYLQVKKTWTMFTKAATQNRIILPSLVLLTCLVISYLNWEVAFTGRKNEVRSYFEYRARDVNTRIEQRIINYEQVLRNMRGLFDASDNVNRTEFYLFYNALLLDKYYPGIQGVGFSLIISPGQLKTHIAAVRNEGFPEYKIWPEGNRNTYTSIIYLEPFKELNLQAFGYDMFSEPVRRKAMETARDSNKTMISGKVNLVQETGIEIQAGFLIYLPVYKKGAPCTTTSERRLNLIGWVYSPFRMGDFMNGLFGELSADLDVEIYDSKNISNETLMYSSKTHSSNLAKPLTLTKIIDFNGHTWTVSLKSTHLLESRIGFSPAKIILIVGIGLSILFAIITWLLVNKRIYSIAANKERMLAENSLKKLQEEQEILLYNIPAWVFYKDAENRFVRVNKTFADVMGMSVEQLEGKSLFDIFPKEQADAFWRDDLEVLTSGKAKVNIIELMESPKGTIYAQTDKIPYRDSEGKVVGLIGFTLDITERKRAEEALSESESRFRSLFENAVFGLYRTTPDGTIILANKMLVKMLGYPSFEKLAERDLAKEGFDPSYKREKFLEQIEKEGEIINTESNWIRLDGTSISVCENTRAIRDSKGKTLYYDGIVEDITERKISENELKKSHEQLLKLNAEKDKFFSIIAHDLRSPFNGFIGLTGLMADKTENFSPAEFIEYSKLLNKAAKNLYKLLENLLQWAQIKNGSADFTPQVSDLSKMVSQSIDVIYQWALQKGITIVNEIKNSQKVYVDEKMIGSVLRNLLSNAVKFTRTDGKVFVKSKRSDNGTIEISVEDNGVGIPECDVKRLFRIEEKVSTKGTDEELSTGLGLFLCKEFIEMHGGKIWAESKENIGSTFYFTLPGEDRNENK